MTTVIEGDLTFTFPPNWEIVKFDNTTFYRNHAQHFANSKCVDVVAIDLNMNTAWLIEIKDYRAHDRTKMLPVFEEIAIKVRDTLATIFLASKRSNGDDLQFSQKACQVVTFRVAFHLEQPIKPSKLYPQIVDRTNAKLKLKQAVRAADPHPHFCEIANMPASCAWHVQ